jgi:hypothetical protein
MRTDKMLWRNRKGKKELARRLQSENPGLEVVHPHAAGIDVGNSAHYVAVRPDRDPQPVRRFECFTADLHRLANWLQSCGVEDRGLVVAHCFSVPKRQILAFSAGLRGGIVWPLDGLSDRDEVPKQRVATVKSHLFE